jgi:two-component system, sensor histidine kinase and response regulator
MGTWAARWKRRSTFVDIAVVVVAACGAFAFIVEFRFPTPTAATAIDDVGEAVAAFVAAACCAYATTQTAGRIRLAWALLGISAGSWGAGETVWAVYEAGLGQEVPYPGWPDVGFIVAIPFAFAGIRALWREPRGTASKWRVWLDAVIIALALTFTAWVLGLRLVWQNTEDGGLEKFLDLAYPVGDILIGTVLILALRRATRRRAARVLMLLVGVAALSVADSAFAYLSANGAYGVHGSVLDTGWFAGYLVIALAAAWPRTAVATTAENVPVDLWQLALPWLAVLATGLCTLGLVFTGQTLDRFLTLLVGVGIVLLTATMILTNRDFLAMLIKSRTSEARLADVIDRAPIGIARADTTFRMIGANPALGALLLERPESMLGFSLDRYIPAEDQEPVFQKLGKLARFETEAADGECPLIRSDGSRVWSHWTSKVVKDASGETDYFLTMIENIDARHRAEESAKASLATLDRLNSLKSEFLQSVSHEFKTALIGIQGFSEFMRDADELDIHDVRGFAADIHRDAERLDRMVTEMVALDQVESTRANVQFAPVSLNAVIEHEAAGAQVNTTATIVVELEPGLPAVSGDEEKLGLVVRTLLGNAVKYSPEEGHITIGTAAQGDLVMDSVRDEGVAARADFDNRLFGHDDLYANNPIRKVVSTGLGLGIVRQVVEMHGGRLWVDRVEGHGSEFHFTLPALVEAVPVEAGGMVA